MTGASHQTMPLLFRVFARYCRLAPQTRRGLVFGAEFVHLVVSWLTRVMGWPDSVRIAAGSHIVHLRITDPRSLVVPSEILNLVETGLLAGLLTEGHTFIDIGANHGSFSIVASKLVGASGQIVAVEPQPRLAQLVEASLSENCRCPFTVLQMACADFDGEQDLFVPYRTSGSANLYHRFATISAGRHVRVRVRRFDDAIDWRSFTSKVVMKVDIEGAELSFLRGATRALEHLRPAIIIEINPSAARAAGTSVRELVGQLKTLNYDAFRELHDPTARDLALLGGDRPRNIVLLPRGRSA